MLRAILRGGAPCALCRGEVSGPRSACAACLADLPWRDWEPAAVTHRLVVAPGLAVHAALAYRYPLDRIIARAKAGGSPELILDITGQSVDGLPESLVRTWAGLRPCAVPTTPDRLRRRRIDLPRQLACSLALALRCQPFDLVHRPTAEAHAAQHGLGGVRRRGRAPPAFKAREPLRGARLLLVDDVCTTGATLAAYARGLKAAGAIVGGACVLALADPPGRQPVRRQGSPLTTHDDR